MSSIPHNISSKKRVLSILRTLVKNPGFYTKRKLAEIHATSLDTITRDFEEIRNAGFDLRSDSNHRYFFTAEKATDLIKGLMP
ncbi:MAG: putative DNA-binding transcriptional regulator YafY [Arcticibacterium sp.]|jgi:predicted DNA-binding transcriptional regulator YafY